MTYRHSINKALKLKWKKRMQKRQLHTNWRRRIEINLMQIISIHLWTYFWMKKIYAKYVIAWQLSYYKNHTNQIKIYRFFNFKTSIKVLYMYALAYSQFLSQIQMFSLYLQNTLINRTLTEFIPNMRSMCTLY